MATGALLNVSHSTWQLFQPLLSEGRASLSPSGENSPEDQDTSALEEPAKPGPRPAVSRPTAHQYLSTETHQGDHTLHGSKHRPRDAGASEPVSQERSHHQSLQRQPPTRPPRWKAEARRGQGSRVGPDWVRTPCFSGCRWLSRPHFPVSRQPHRVIELLLGLRGYWSRPFPFLGVGAPPGHQGASWGQGCLAALGGFRGRPPQPLQALGAATGRSTQRWGAH